MTPPDDIAPIAVDAETALAHAPPGHKDELRLWLRLLTCTTLVEGEIRARLRRDFDTTLPRFDLMAALDRAPGGVTLGEISRRMMVSNGNVTGLAARLESEGLVERRAMPGDRRAQLLRLTARGRREFAANPRRMKSWIANCSVGWMRRSARSCSACSAAPRPACAPRWPREGETA